MNQTHRSDNPFPGLRSFTPEEDYLFFGREEQTMELLQTLGAHRFVAVVGTSGSGKSSLVRCGLLSQLLGGKMLQAGTSWEVAVTHPGAAPMSHLAESLLAAGLHDASEEDAKARLLATLSRSHLGLIEAIRQAQLPAGTNFLLVVDQFEEIFRFNQSGVAQRDVASEFVSMLLQAAAQKDVPIYIVLTMRSDFIGDCAQFEHLAEAVNRGEYLIPRMTREQFKQTIEGPIRVAGGRISPRLLQRLLNDLGDQQDQLPCLQHALMRTWDQWRRSSDLGAPAFSSPAEGQNQDPAGRRSALPDPRSLDLEDYHAIGRMREALSRHADELYECLGSDRARQLCMAMFKALTVRESENRGIRRPQTLGRLAQIVDVPAAELTPIIEAFRQPGVTFLMPPPEVPLLDTAVIDISHESLMRVWVRLRDWVEEEASSVGIFHRLAESAALHGKGKAGLYRDPELGIALSWRDEAHANAAWAEQYGGHFDPAMAYLDRSREAAEREEKEREAARQRELERARQFAEAQAKVARLFKRFAGSLAVGLILAVALTIWAFMLRQEAKRQEATAQQQRQLAQEKEREALQQQQRAELSEANTAALLYGANLNVAQVSFEQSNIPQTRRLLDQTRSHAARGFEWYYWQRELHRATRILRGHAGYVERVAFSPDGRRILTQGEDNVILIRDAASGEEQLRVKAGKFLQFSPDGERLLCSLNGVQIRSASTGAELISTDLVSFGTFTPDGKQFATVRGQRAVFRDAVTGKELSSFKAFSHYMQWYANPIAFSPDGRWMLNGNSNPHGGAALHDAVTGDVVKIFAQGEDLHVGVFSPDGRRIVTTARFGTEPAVWDIAQPERPLARLSGQPGARVSFSPDGRRLLAGSGPRVTLWDAETFKEMGDFQGHTGAIRDVAFSPDGQWVAAASEDGTARIWAADAFAGPQVLQDPAIGVGAFSPDGRHLATGRDGFAVIWETATRKPLHRLKVYNPLPGKIPVNDEESVESVGFSLDGRRLVAAGGNFVAIVFDVASGRPLLTLDHASTNLSDRKVISAVFSPDGKQIVTMNNLKVRTWDAESGQLLRTKNYTKTNGLHTIPPVGFTPDGRLYCASIEEVTIWDAVTGEERFHLPVENARMLNAGHPAISFSPDGKRFALACPKWRGVIQIHEATSGRLLRRLEGHRERVASLEFSPDGDRLLSGSFDATAKIWDLGSGRELLSFKAPKAVSHARFTPDGRMIFVGGHFKEGLLWEAATPEQVTAWEAEETTGAAQWAAMTEELYQRLPAGWAANEEAGKTRRAAFVKATEEKLARLGDPALFGKLPGTIRQWLALSAPSTYQLSEIILEDEPIPDEARLRPRAQESIRVGGSERVWAPLQLEDYRIDFRTAIVSGDGETAAYAVSYILSERDQSGLVLKVGSDYHAKIYLNQREIYRRVHPATAEPDRDTVTGVHLKAGLNVLVFKVVRQDGNSPWSGSVRFTTADGQPVKGISVTLDPDAKK